MKICKRLFPGIRVIGLGLIVLMLQPWSRIPGAGRTTNQR